MSRTARVTFSYAAKEEDELNLEVGDIITNIADVDEGWCEGKLYGKKGMFPSNYVKEVIAPEPSSNVNTDEGYCPVIKNYNIHVSSNTGPVAVGSKSAKINVGHTEELEGYENPDKQTVPEEDEYQHGGYYQGSYCRTSSQRQSVEREKEWDPTPGKGILIKKGRKMFSEVQYSIQSFLDNPDRFIQDMDNCAGLSKEQREQFILLEILPHLEESFGKCSSSNEDVYKILAKISCSKNSGKVVKHALMQLFHLSCKDDFGSTGNDNLLVVEATLRSSIFSPNGIFKNDEHSEQDIKLFVYSRILTLLWIQKVRHEELPTIIREDELKKAKEELKKLKNRKKGVFRYSMELIQSTISHFLQPRSKLMASKLSGFLDECRTFCGNPKMECEDLTIHHTLSERNKSFLMNTRNEWINLHCILIHLHGKVQSKHQFPKLTVGRQAMKLITLIVEAYLQSGGGEDWRFCLLASSILVDVAKNNEAQELREKARNSLLDLLKDEKLQKKPECREILERRSSELLFCPDRKTREKLADFLLGDESLQDIKDTLQTEHLCSAYRIQTLEVNKTIVHQSSSCFVNTGMFQGRKHLLEEDPKWKTRELLIREAYGMMRLNAYQHPNFPVLLAYDTKSLPYHLITEFERWGDLLQFLWVYRERNTQLQLIRLLNMLLNIGCALLYLEELGLAHRCVMAANVLVGDNYVCKLSGLHFIQKFTCGPRPNDDVDGFPCYENMYKFNDEDIPVRWKAPECITEHRYSTASDIWAFGMLMYEVLTYGCKPYRGFPNDDEVPSRVVDRKEIVPHESCFEDKEYELIRQCCEWQFIERLDNITELNCCDLALCSVTYCVTSHT